MLCLQICRIWSTDWFENAEVETRKLIYQLNYLLGRSSWRAISHKKQVRTINKCITIYWIYCTDAKSCLLGKTIASGLIWLKRTDFAISVAGNMAKMVYLDFAHLPNWKAMRLIAHRIAECCGPNYLILFVEVVRNECLEIQLSRSLRLVQYDCNFY